MPPHGEDEGLPERERAHRKPKKLKTEHGGSGGDAVADFIPIPDDIASKVPKSHKGPKETHDFDNANPERRKRSRSQSAPAPNVDSEVQASAANKRRKRQDERREARQQKRTKRPEKGQAEEAARNGPTRAVEEVEELLGEQQQAKAIEKRNSKEEKKERIKRKDGATMCAVAKVLKNRKRTHNHSDDEPRTVAAAAAAVAESNTKNGAVNAKHWIAGEVQGEDPKSKSHGEDSKKDKSQRFIAFIGNLPYTATSDSITKHFSAIAPFHVRAPTDPSTGQSKGYAFLEFEGYDKMKSCLKLYHHSNFGEGKKARKINVELTAGGGGNTEARKTKIKEKNEKLQEERKKTHEDEAKARQGGKRNGRAQADGAGEKEGNNNDIHPSRRKRMGL